MSRSTSSIDATGGKGSESGTTTTALTPPVVTARRSLVTTSPSIVYTVSDRKVSAVCCAAASVGIDPRAKPAAKAAASGSERTTRSGGVNIEAGIFGMSKARRAFAAQQEGTNKYSAGLKKLHS